MLGHGVWSALGMLAVTVGILALAWQASRWISGPSALTGRSGGRLRALDQLVLGRNERLVLVSVGEDCCLLLGVTERRITLLKAWEGDQPWLAEETPPPGFLDMLQQAAKRKQ